MSLAGAVKDCFNTAIVINSVTNAVLNGIPTPSTSQVFSGVCAFYLKSASEQLIADRLGSKATYNILLDPNDIAASSLNNNMIAVINSTNYRLDVPEDIMEQNDVIQVGAYIDD